MTGLIDQIQAAAIDPSSSISDLLRRVKLAAAKLQLSQPIEWADNELTGYFGVEERQVPRYRHLSGRLMEQVGSLGTREAFGDARMIAMMSYVVVRESISSVETLYASKGDTLAMAADNAFVESLQRHEAFQDRTFHVRFGKNVLFGIMDHVRTLVLDWALALEQQGILGEGITFTVAEKEIAAAAGMTINVGYMAGGIQQATVTGDGNTTNLSSDQSAITNHGVLTDLSAAIERNVAHASDREAMLALIKQLDAQQGKPGFKLPLAELMEYAANYATVLGPFLPALTKMIPS